jgi:cytochrome c2
MRLLGIILAAGMMLSACAPAATALPLTLAPTTEPTTIPTVAPTPAATAVPATATEAAAATPTVVPTLAIVSVGTDIKQTLPAGDAARGEQTVAALECTRCHAVAPGDAGCVGPCWAARPSNDNLGIATRAETRFLAPDYTGHAASAQEYLFESIVLPSDYIIDFIGYEFSPGRSLMPGNYAPMITAQGMADIIAYLETLKRARSHQRAHSPHRSKSSRPDGLKHRQAGMRSTHTAAA